MEDLADSWVRAGRDHGSVGFPVDAFVAALVRSLPLAPEDWLRRMFDVLLTPLMHVIYTYGITFNPHGQNTLLIFDEHDVPQRLILKDLVDDVCVSHHPMPERDIEPDSHEHLRSWPRSTSATRSTAIGWP